LVLGPQFGAYGETAADLSLAFVSQAALDGGDTLPTRRRRTAVRGTRGIGLPQMLLNNRIAAVRVHAATATVTLDGDPISSPPADRTALNRLYFL
jgi:urease subunit alpha